MTQNQMHELLESEQAKVMLENAEDRGFLEPAELEAFALEHDLSEDEVDQFTRELETIGVEVGLVESTLAVEACGDGHVVRAYRSVLPHRHAKS